MAETGKDTEEQNRMVIDEIIRLSDFNFERLPMLDIVGARFSESISVTLPEETSAYCEASTAQVEYVPMSQVLEGLPSEAMTAICSCSSLDGEIMLAYDHVLVLTYLELMLGGAGMIERAEARNEFTAIEKEFGAKLTRTLLSELSNSLAPVETVEFELESIEVEPDSASIVPQASLCARLKISVVLAEQNAQLQIMLPYDTLQPLRRKLARVHFGDGSGNDENWQRTMSDEVGKSVLDLEVVLSEFTLNLDTITDFAIGQVVEIGPSARNQAVIKCDSAPMFQGNTGRKNNGSAAIQITEVIDLQQGEAR